MASPAPRRLYYMICTNPRSGSWLLAEGLEGTGIAGHPREWFNEYEEREYPLRWGIPAPSGSYEQYLSRLLEEGTTANGVFGLKCMGFQFATLRDKLKTIPGYGDLSLHQ